MRSKSKDLVKWFAERIRRGDYDMRGIPSGRRLATQLGVSQNTTYKVLDLLVDQGLLIRKENGRLAVQKASERPDNPRRVAFLRPSFVSDHFDMVGGIWRRGIDKAAAHQNVQVRPLIYMDYDDPVIHDAVNSFEGVFFFAMQSPVPRPLVRFFQSWQRRVAAIGCDLSKDGIRSVRLCSALSLQSLLDHLASLGHRRIDCLNVHPMSSPDVEERISTWQIWKRAHGLSGDAINDPIHSLGVPFGDAFQQAREIMRRSLFSGDFQATALYCTSMPAALGAMRALMDAGLQVGRDVSVCAASDEGICRYLTPSLTSLAIPDPYPYLDLCLESMFAEEAKWSAPVLLQPERMDLLLGDTTGPLIESRGEVPEMCSKGEAR